MSAVKDGASKAETSDAEDSALAAAYERGLAAEKQGRFEQAAAAYRDALALDPTDMCGASVRLASLAQGPVPGKAPDAYVATLFDQHAEAFETILVGQLGYDAPERIGEILAERTPNQLSAVLDLGCGTGLVGEALDAHDCLNPDAAVLGVDLAEAMIEIAAEKDVYTELFVGEAVRFLATLHEHTASGPFDLIVAADVLPYVGDPLPFLDPALAALQPGGTLVFTTEELSDFARSNLGSALYGIGPNQRFQHDGAALRRWFETHAVYVDHEESIVVRKEMTDDIPGVLFCVRKM